MLLVTTCYGYDIRPCDWLKMSILDKGWGLKLVKLLLITRGIHRRFSLSSHPHWYDRDASVYKIINLSEATSPRWLRRDLPFVHRLPRQPRNINRFINFLLEPKRRISDRDKQYPASVCVEFRRHTLMHSLLATYRMFYKDSGDFLNRFPFFLPPFVDNLH